jgi:hypothetical protein
MKRVQIAAGAGILLALLGMLVSACGNPAGGAPQTYVAGYYDDGGNSKPCYWAGGTKQDLPLGDGARGFAQAIAVSGGTVYAAGYYVDGGGSDIPCYWAGGTKQDLPIGDGTGGGAGAIAVSGGSVYVAGSYVTGSNSTPCYWAGGTKYDLPIGNGTEGGALAIAVELR